MKVEPRVVLLTLLIGAGATTTMVVLALYLPMEGFLVLLFPSFLFWILVPFILLHIWRRLFRRREG
ncbi:MAG: hypothetical protein ACE5HJ_06170 [Thermoplasmata archaeon]